jgi:tRNA A-37 threonylcarbamoyl transferase component Bud32
MSGDVEPGRVLGRYVVESAIGAGGFATVYRARDTGLDRPVALKVLDPRAHRNPTVARRFVHEGRAVASLDHPAVVPVYDAGEQDDLLWMAMRLVEGPSLEAALDAGRRFTTAEVVSLAERIGSALDHAHAQGIVHRDVKPSNILLEDDDPARAWLADFGIAVTARTAGRYTTGTLGTAAYMAPEQARPSEVGPAADVYSFACVVYELVAGRRPFDGDDHVGLLMAHAGDPVPATGDPGVDAVLQRALAKAPADRPSPASAFAAELRVALPDRGDRPLVPVGPPRPNAHAHAGAEGSAPAVDADATVLSTEAGALRAPTVAEDRTMAYPAVPPPPPPPGPGSAPPRTAAAPAAPDAGRPLPPAARPPAVGRRPPAPGSPPGPRPAADLPPVRDPTVTRRGRTRARRNLVLGAAALAVAGMAVGLSVAADRDGGGSRQCDEAGLCLTLPPGWSVGEVEPGHVTLERGGTPAGAYTHEPSTSTGADGALREASGVDCAAPPAVATVGGVVGARCETTGGGVAVAAIDGGRLWVVTVTGEAPSGEADDLVGSLELG